MLTIDKINKIDFETESEILKALANPIRLQMVGLLMNDECCVTDITHTLGISQSTSSQHLKILKSVGIVYPKKYGNKTCYIVDNQDVIQILSILINKYNNVK